VKTKALILTLIGLLALTLMPLAAQDPIPTSAPIYTIKSRAAVLFAGPGDSFAQVGWIEGGSEIRLLERNSIGNWLRITRRQGGKVLDGWVMTGFLKLPPDLKFSQVPVNTTVADGDPDTTNSESLARLFATPVISEISPKMQEVYQLGQSLGNQSHVFTKIGDSLTHDPLFLPLMSQKDYVLGPYDYLEDTILYFGESAAQPSIAADLGMTTYTIFDPMWARSELCQPEETPLACEYRLKKPSIALVLFGPNDIRHSPVENFNQRMRRLVDESLAAGIIPVLSTFTYNPDSELWPQALAFNVAIVEVAEDTQVPLINLFAAARPLPDYGLDIDATHMTHSGFRYIKFDTGHESWYGVSLRMLLTLRMLDELRVTLEMD
jgi:hypothetical protein